MSGDIKAFFKEQARAGNGSFAIAYALLELASSRDEHLSARGEFAGAGRTTPTGEEFAHHLMTLATLRDQGALTEEEFAAQKSKLLS